MENKSADEILDELTKQDIIDKLEYTPATAAQGEKADSAVQAVAIDNVEQPKENGVVNLPAYPTKESLGLENVENKSAAEIIGELTAEDVVAALDYTPATSEQGDKADSAVQKVKVNGTEYNPTSGLVTLPDYPTKASLELNKVENKTSAEIRGELTSEDVVAALGFTPADEAHIEDTNTTYTLETGSANGTLTLKGSDGGNSTNIPVKGLGSAAYTDSSAYATAAQGSKAATSVQKITVNSQDYTPTNGVVSLPDYPTGNVTGSSLTSDSIITGNGNSAIKSSGKTIATSVSDVDTTVPTSKAVKSYVDTTVGTAISNLPEPMVFRGSLGTGGTITTLPTNGTASVGDTYKVITAGTYNSQAAKVGDLFICDSKTANANTWTYIPSADEPSGTVTSVTIKGSSPIVVDSESAITSSGTRTISHAVSGATAASYGDNAAQTPGYGDTFKVPYVTVDKYGHVTAISDHTVKIPAKPTYSASDVGAATSAQGDKADSAIQSAGTGLSKSGTTLNHSNSITAGTASGSATKTLTFGGTFDIPSVTYDAQGHITGKSTTTMTMPAKPTYTASDVGAATSTQGSKADTAIQSAGTGLSKSGTTLNHSNSVTAGTASGSATKTLTFGDTFTIPSVTYDAQGHITSKGTTTMTMPANPNTDRYVNTASFAHDSTNNNVKMTLTRAGSDTATVIANIPKVSSSSAGVVPKGAAVSSQSQTTKFLREDGTWAAPSYTTNTNTTYSAGTGTTITGTNNAINVTYGTAANTACQGNDSRLSDARTPTAHNQAANTINAMTGYSKPSSTSAISTSDTLNSAIGKLEKALDNKANSSSLSSYLPTAGGTMTGDITFDISSTNRLLKSSDNGVSLEIQKIVDSNFKQGGIKISTGNYDAGKGNYFSVDQYGLEFCFDHSEWTTRSGRLLIGDVGHNEFVSDVPFDFDVPVSFSKTAAFTNATTFYNNLIANLDDATSISFKTSDNKKAFTLSNNYADITASSVGISSGTGKRANVIVRGGNVEIGASDLDNGVGSNIYVSYDEIGITVPDDGIYMERLDSGSGNNLVIDASGYIYKQSSSRDVKHDIEYIEDYSNYHNALMNFKPATFIYNGDIDNTTKLGMIAEDVDELCPIATFKDKNGKVENYDDRAIISMLVMEVQRLNKELDELKNK